MNGKCEICGTTWTAREELPCPTCSRPTTLRALLVDQLLRTWHHGHRSTSTLNADREAQSAADALLARMGEEGWLLVSEAGQPEPGLYLAIHRDGNWFPVGLCDYGKYEFYDEDGEREDADDEGYVRGFGWHQEEMNRHDDGYVFLRDVVAYQPANYSLSDPAMRAIRARLAAAPTGESGGAG